MKISITKALIISALVAPVAAYAQSTDTPSSSESSTSAAEGSAGSSSANRSLGTTASDAAITAKVKTELIKDKDVSAMDINVDTMNGVVTLEGKVQSPDLSEKAATLARSVEGVKSVKNDIQVSAAVDSTKGASSGATQGSSTAEESPSLKGASPDTSSDVAPKSPRSNSAPQ